MMPSVDGRLKTEHWDVPKAGHAEYDKKADSFNADAWMCGRVTMEEFADGRWRGRARKRSRDREDFIAPMAEKRRRGKTFAVALDPEGKLDWRKGTVEGDPLIVVLSKEVPDAYLEHLRERGVSYVFGGARADRMDLAAALGKLREEFGIEKLVLEGGGEINGSFLREGLIDELSLLLTPVADGHTGEPALFDLEEVRPTKKAVADLELLDVERAAAGMLWVRYRVKGNAS